MLLREVWNDHGDDPRTFRSILLVVARDNASRRALRTPLGEARALIDDRSKHASQRQKAQYLIGSPLVYRTMQGWIFESRDGTSKQVARIFCLAALRLGVAERARGAKGGIRTSPCVCRCAGSRG